MIFVFLHDVDLFFFYAILRLVSPRSFNQVKGPGYFLAQINYVGEFQN